MFFGVWTYQIFWVYIVCSPVFFLLGTLDTDPDLRWGDFLGMALWVLGFLTQSIADLQKYSFRSDPGNKKRFCNVGLWKYSRHPPYFGEILQWWGLFSLNASTLSDSNALWGYATILSPLFTMVLLLLVSGIPLAEGKAMARWYGNPDVRDAFDDYFKSTPPLVLFPPALYRRMPLILKRVLCFELDRYAYVESSMNDCEAPEPAETAHIQRALSRAASGGLLHEDPLDLLPGLSDPLSVDHSIN